MLYFISKLYLSYIYIISISISMSSISISIYAVSYVCNHGPLGSWMILGSRIVRHPHFLVESFGEVSGLLPSSDTVAHAVSVVFVSSFFWLCLRRDIIIISTVRWGNLQLSLKPTTLQMQTC